MRNSKSVFGLFISLTFSSSLAFAQSLSPSQLESLARTFVQQKNIYPAGATLSARHLSSVFKNSGVVFVRNLSSGSSVGTTLIVHSATNIVAVGNDMKASVGALNMFIPQEGMQIRSAADAKNFFLGLLQIVESNAKDVRCEAIASEFRCFYNRAYGQASVVFIQKNGILR